MEILGFDLEEPLTDEELASLALSTEPLMPLAQDAVPMSVHLARFAPTLPLWYMPPPVSRSGRRWKAPLVITIVSAFLLIDALGLCNTYGILSLA